MADGSQSWKCGWTDEVRAIVAAGGDITLVGDRAVAFWVQQYGFKSTQQRIKPGTPFSFYAADVAFQKMRQAVPAEWRGSVSDGSGEVVGTLERDGDVRRVEVFRRVPGLDLFEPFWTSAARVESLGFNVPGPLAILGSNVHRLRTEQTETARERVTACIDVVNCFVTTLANHDPEAALERAICLIEALALPDTRRVLTGSEIPVWKALPVESIKRITQLGSGRQRVTAEDALRRWAEVEREYRAAGEGRSLAE